MVTNSEENSDAVTTASFKTTTPSVTTTTMVEKIHSKAGKAFTNPTNFTKHVQETCPSTQRGKKSFTLRSVATPLVGRPSVIDLPLTKQESLSQYSGCFKEIGHFLGEPYKFHIKSDASPARHASRQVPIHLRDHFREEINSLIELGIVKEVHKDTD